MIKKIISIMRQDERKFKRLVTKLGGRYYYIPIRYKQAGYYTFDVIFNTKNEYTVLEENLNANHYEFYYPEYVGD